MISILQNMYEKDKDAWLQWWNTDLLTYQSNCYSYAVTYPWTYFNLGEITNPGFGKNPNIRYKTQTIQDLGNAMVSDGLSFVKTEEFKDIPTIVKEQDCYLTAVFATLAGCDISMDKKSFDRFMNKKPFHKQTVRHYHIIRQHSDGTWSERNGAQGKVGPCKMSKDGKTPERFGIDKHPSFFVGYYSVPNTGLNFGIPAQLASMKNPENLRLAKYNNIVSELIDFNKIISFDGAREEKLAALRTLTANYPQFVEHFLDTLKNTGGGWQKAIFNTLEDVNKSKTQLIFEKLFRKR